MTRKRQKTEALAARVPAALKASLAEVARERGMDLSGLVNVILADALPGQLEWMQTQRARLAAATNGTAKEKTA